MSVFETERLVIRPWREDDAENLYKYASDPEVGPAAGWPVHTSVEDSLRVLREVLIEENTWAVTIKASDEPVDRQALLGLRLYTRGCSSAH